METGNSELYAAQLMRYFITHREFVPVKFINVNDPSRITEDDTKNIWLMNPKYEKYPIVLISTEPGLNENFINLGYSTLISNMKKPGRMLHIDLSTHGRTYSDEIADHIFMAPGLTVSDHVLQAFPSIDTVLVDSTNPAAETERISRSIREYSMNHQRKPRTAISVLKERFTWLFLIGLIPSVIFSVATFITETALGISLTASAVVWGAYYKSFVTVLGQWWRFLTSGFVHASVMHIFFNMFALFDLARITTAGYGTLKGAIIMFVSVIFGNLAVFAGDGNTVAVGLSGGLYGLLGASIIYYWQNDYFKTREIRRGVFSTLITNAIISFMPSISWLSHLGGLIAGLVLGVLLSKKTEKSFLIHVIIASLVSTIAVGFLAYNNRDFNKYDVVLDTQVLKTYSELGLKEHAIKAAEKLNKYYSRGN